jgi:hypothetical protein
LAACSTDFFFPPSIALSLMFTSTWGKVTSGNPRHPLQGGARFALIGALARTADRFRVSLFFLDILGPGQVSSVSGETALTVPFAANSSSFHHENAITNDRSVVRFLPPHVSSQNFLHF